MYETIYRMTTITSQQRILLLMLHDKIDEVSLHLPRESEMADEWLRRAAVLLIEARTLIEIRNEGRRSNSDTSS